DGSLSLRRMSPRSNKPVNRTCASQPDVQLLRQTGMSQPLALSAVFGVALSLPPPAAPYRQASSPASTEELVYARAGDGIVSGGALFRPRDGSSAAHVAAIWIHGSGVNFYYPSYVKIARELAKRGLPTVVGNTRMHDLGNIEA